jgi:predicted AlkP superfamily phosphohydrolase/phosphomutase
MAEDTWALNEGTIDDTAFLNQAYSILAEREGMFENALASTRHGVVACVVDTSDRVQHMFYRHLESNPAPIRDLYERMDKLVGKTMNHVDQDTILFVLSDHGFCHFRRAVNLNTWLQQNGYLALDNAGSIDWPNTRAYCLGLSGLYLNLRGREAHGIVEDATGLKNELISKLTGLPDGEQIAIRQVYATDRLYHGPYLDAAPDLIVGYNEGYRVSWDAALGKASAVVIEDNPKPWSGDHCVDPVLVPGVLFCSRTVQAEDPGIEDMAPTALELFGVEPPAWMDGKAVHVA